MLNRLGQNTLSKTKKVSYEFYITWDNGEFNNSKEATEILGSFHREKLTWENNDLLDLHITFSTESIEKLTPNELFAIELK